MGVGRGSCTVGRGRGRGGLPVLMPGVACHAVTAFSAASMALFASIASPFGTWKWLVIGNHNNCLSG